MSQRRCPSQSTSERCSREHNHRLRVEQRRCRRHPKISVGGLPQLFPTNYCVASRPPGRQCCDAAWEALRVVVLPHASGARARSVTRASPLRSPCYAVELNAPPAAEGRRGVGAALSERVCQVELLGDARVQVRLGQLQGDRDEVDLDLMRKLCRGYYTYICSCRRHFHYRAHPLGLPGLFLLGRSPRRGQH